MPNDPVPATAPGLPARPGPAPGGPPSGGSRSTVARRIPRVVDWRPGFDGKVRTAATVLDVLDASAVSELRHQVRAARTAGRRVFSCPACSAPLHVRVKGVTASGVTDGRRASFAHDPAATRRSCPYGTFSEGSPDDVNARRFDGKQEGPRHRFLKLSLLQALRHDPAFSGSVCEKRASGTCPRKLLSGACSRSVPPFGWLTRGVYPKVRLRQQIAA